MSVRPRPTPCCGPSRRTVLGALGLATLLPANGIGQHSKALAQQGPIVAGELEVVTVTDESVVLTWTTRTPDAAGQPVATDGEVRLGPADSRRKPTQVWSALEPTPFHYAEIDGLEPGRTYRFEAWSSGVRAAPAATVTTRLPGVPEVTGEFTTLVPPPGRKLRTIALANDVHYGEAVSGLLAGDLPPGFRREPGLPPYPEVMLDALLDDLRAPDRAAGVLLLAGDLTSEATDIETRSVRSHLDTWGTAGSDYLAVRGNHDRPHTGDEYRTCGPAANTPEYHDCWADHFGTNGDRQQLLEHEVGELRLLGVDTSALEGSGGVLERPQLDQLSRLLRAEPDRPTVIFGHHPVTAESGATNLGGPGFVLNSADSAALQNCYAEAPGVFLQHSGHTHRNRRTRSDNGCAVEFLEVGAVKEYPGGYSLLRIYEGGYMVNFYKTRSSAARQWSTLTRGEYFGFFPDYTLGSCADRNHVLQRDFSGLT